MDWIPEAKAAAGGLAAEGFYKLLGRPRLDPLTVLVRETAQNSWDARLQNGQPVDFTIQGWELSTAEARALREQVFVRAAEAQGTNLAQELRSSRPLGLYITDRNTKGLGGPVQANQVDSEGVYDWVDFVLNVGEANTQGHSGGTYGFGKTISYVVSSANAIVIHSRTRVKGRLQTRLIACALGTKFARRNSWYTGRHWWGEKLRGDPTPVTGREADRIARLIGMPEFREGETGTNILVVAPDFGGRSPEQAMRFIAESITWHLWPKLARFEGQAAMNIDVSWNGDPLEIPEPKDRPPLHGFATAFDALRQVENGSTPDTPGLKIDHIRCLKPIADVGVLATIPLVHRDRAAVDDGSDPSDPEAPHPAAAILGVCHHVALLRTPELVVDYLEGPPLPEGGVEWAGVFRVNDKQDHHFARSEPPTHDRWNPELLEKSQGRTIVRVGLREIGVALEDRWGHRTRPEINDPTSTALVAKELAYLAGASVGRAPGKHGEGETGGAPIARRPKLTLLEARPVEMQGDIFGTFARFRLTDVPGSAGSHVTVKVAAALDGTSADDDLDPQLALIELRVDGADLQVSGHRTEFDIPPAGSHELELLVRRGPETTVLFDLDAEKRS
jgi:hypothetical protein